MWWVLLIFSMKRQAKTADFSGRRGIEGLRIEEAGHRLGERKNKQSKKKKKKYGCCITLRAHLRC